jgi:hypothetical protein
VTVSHNPFQNLIGNEEENQPLFLQWVVQNYRINRQVDVTLEDSTVNTFVVDEGAEGEEYGGKSMGMNTRFGLTMEKGFMHG